MVRCWVLSLVACKFAPGTVPNDLPPDASIDAPPDARAFDPAQDCPSSYLVIVPSTTSRYRVITDLATFWPHEAACNADLPGRTHAAVLDDMQELVEVAAQTTIRVYVGGVQSPTAVATSSDWITFHGAPLIATAWHTNESEPDDGGDLIENHESQLLIIDPALPYFHDAAGISLYGILCECDGIAVDPTARAFIDADPNNPN